MAIRKIRSHISRFVVEYVYLLSSFSRDVDLGWIIDRKLSVAAKISELSQSTHEYPVKSIGQLYRVLESLFLGNDRPEPVAFFAIISLILDLPVSFPSRVFGVFLLFASLRTLHGLL